MNKKKVFECIDKPCDRYPESVVYSCKNCIKKVEYPLAEEDTCGCKEMSCQEDCTKNHTHKGFSCDKCEDIIVKDGKRYKLID